MARILFVVGSEEGHTQDLTSRALSMAQARGHEVYRAPAQELYQAVAAGEYDAFIVGASVHHGHHQTAVKHFVTDNLARLNATPSAFFSVSLNAAVPQRQPEAQAYLDTFLAETGWQPQSSLLVAGALKLTDEDYFRRELARYISEQTVGHLPDFQDYDFTDYTAFEAFIDAFLVLLE